MCSFCVILNSSMRRRLMRYQALFFKLMANCAVDADECCRPYLRWSSEMEGLQMYFVIRSAKGAVSEITNGLATVHDLRYI
jgi:hypothetical protein